MIDVAVAIIAGGKSSRFGSSKMDADFHGKRLIDHAVSIALNLSEEVMIISGRQAASRQAGLPVYRDIIPDCGPLGGIYTALVQANSKWVAVMPVDMPLLSPHIYEFLIPFTDRQRPVAARSNFGLEALVSLWPTIMAPSVEQLLKSGERQVKRVLDHLGGNVISLADKMSNYDEKWFANVNTHKDLIKLLR